MDFTFDGPNSTSMSLEEMNRTFTGTTKLKKIQTEAGRELLISDGVAYLMGEEEWQDFIYRIIKYQDSPILQTMLSNEQNAIQGWIGLETSPISEIFSVIKGYFWGMKYEYHEAYADPEIEGSSRIYFVNDTKTLKIPHDIEVLCQNKTLHLLSEH